MQFNGSGTPGRLGRGRVSACLALFMAAGAAGQSGPVNPSQPTAPAGSTGTPTAQTPTNGRSTSKPNTYTRNGAADTPADPQASSQSPAGTPTGASSPPEPPPIVYEGGAGHGADPSAAGPDVNVSEYLTVDMFVQDEELANVLQMLSLQTRRNIVASKSVSARVTANLYGVTLQEALDAILHVNGYGYLERGNFIYVYTLEELRQVQAEERHIVSKVINLNYLNANDAAEFVSPLLSPKGQIKTNGDVGTFTIPEDTPTGDEQFALASTLVIFDYPEHVAEIEKLLNNLDTKPAQVLVEATILQTTLTEANAFGVDFAFLNGVNMTDFLGLGGLLGSAGTLNRGDQFLPADNRGTSIVGTPGNTSGPATFKLSILHDDIGIFIRALDEVSDVNIVSNPKILALNRQAAKVQIGRKIGYLKSTTNNGVTEQDVEFLPTGTSLAFRPFISKDGMIRMELKPKVSEGIINEFTDNQGRTVTVPDEVSQEITTNVVVPDGSTIVLGGLFRESTRLGRSQVPILGDIPIIGAAFRGRDDKIDRSEIIFLIKPTVVNDNILLSQGERAIEVAEHVRAGSRQGLLPWSRERRTAQLNVQAERLASEGRHDEALYALRRSLELNPSQSDAQRLQERVSGDAAFWPSRSALQWIVNQEARRKASAMDTARPPAANAAADASAATADNSIYAELFRFIMEQPVAPDAESPTVVSTPIDE